MSSAEAGTATSPLLSPTPSATGDQSFRSRSWRLSSRAGLRTAARFVPGPSNGRMMSEQSLRARASAAQHIEERQSEWAYSTPVVILDLIWNAIFVFVAIVVVILSENETTEVPLRLWLVGYGVECSLHMVCVCMEYKRRRRDLLGARVGGGSVGGSSIASGFSSAGPRSGSNSSLNVENNSNNNNHNNYNASNSSYSSSVSVDAGDSNDFMALGNSEGNTSVAKHLESANTIFSFIWWIIGFYWVSSGGQMLADNAPKLYWLTITFLAFDVFFVVICVVVACVIGIAVCCCLPCIIAILYAVADQEGATNEDIERLTRFKFRRLGEMEKPSGEIQESFGGIMTECDTDAPLERAVSAADAVCSICLSNYDDGIELLELTCRHHFHSACIDKWLRMNATCPLCKYNILKNGNQSVDEV